MNLLEVIQNGFKKDELSEMKKALLNKRAAIQKQINHRETDIETMKSNDEIDLPMLKVNAEVKLNKVLVDVKSDYKQLLQAWLEHEQVQSTENISNEEVVKLQAELVPLKKLLEQFPTAEEIKKLKAPVKSSK